MLINYGRKWVYLRILKKVEYFYVYITFAHINIFVNIFQDERKGKHIPVLFSSMNSMELVLGSEKKDFERVEELANVLSGWLKHVVNKRIIVIFKGMGGVFKKLRQTSSVSEYRRTFIREFKKKQVPVCAFFEKSPVAFNGCRVKLKRRRKRKEIPRPLF